MVEALSQERSACQTTAQLALKKSGPEFVGTMTIECDVRPSWLLSEQELIKWLQQQPRTYGWQVLIALDRAKVDALLLQEYIARYARDGSWWLRRTRPK